jgi:hypothetical protein
MRAHFSTVVPPGRGVGLISDFQGVYYQVRQLQNVRQPVAQTIDPKRITLIAFLCGLFCSCSIGNPPKFDNSDWAIDTCSPSQYEIARAEERARNGGLNIRRGTVTNLTIWPSIRRNCWMVKSFRISGRN